MKFANSTSSLILALMLALATVKVWAQDGAPAPCAMALAPQQVEDWANAEVVDFVEETLETQNVKLDLGLMLDIVVPPGYDEHEAEFLARRKRALEELLPLIEEMQAGLTNLEPFPMRLAKLARKYDSADAVEDLALRKKQKAAALGVMLRMFSIPVEQHYIDLIARGDHSYELKQNLGRSLAKIFKSDPSWRPSLDRAMRKAGVGY